MHAQNWNTDIDGVNVQLSDVFSNSAAAALVNFTKFTELPYNVCIVEDCTNFACEFSVAVVGAALTACTCVFNNTYTVVDEGRVLFFISICKCWIECCAYVSRQTFGVRQNASYWNAEWLSQISQEVFQESGVHTGVTVRTNFFFISEDNNRSPFWVGVCDFSCHFSVGANTVVMTICADHASVKTEVSCFESWNNAQFSAQEVSFSDAVFFVEDLHQVQFNLFRSFLIFKLSGTDQNIHGFALECFCQSLSSLFGCQMWQQVGYAENRIVFIFTDGDGNNRTVFLVNVTVQSQRNGWPLVFLDTTIVMWSEVTQFCFFKQWAWFQVKSWGINMSCKDLNAFFDWTGTHSTEDQRFAAVVVVESFTWLIFFAWYKFFITVFFQLSDSFSDCFHFDFGCIHIFFVAFSIIVCFIDLFVRQTGGTVDHLHH